MRVDLLMIILALVLIMFMALTLLYGEGYSRHGHGQQVPPVGKPHLFLVKTAQSSHDPGSESLQIAI